MSTSWWTVLGSCPRAWAVSKGASSIYWRTKHSQPRVIRPRVIRPRSPSSKAVKISRRLWGVASNKHTALEGGGDRPRQLDHLKTSRPISNHWRPSRPPTSHGVAPSWSEKKRTGSGRWPSQVGASFPELSWRTASERITVTSEASGMHWWQ